MDYIGILTKAAQTLWKHKIIAAFSLVFMSIPTILSLVVMGVFVFSIDMSQPERLFRIFNEPLGTRNLPVILGIAGGYFLLMLLSFFCATITFSGVIKGTSLAERGAEPIDFATLWQASLKYFWRVAVIFLAIGAAAVILIVPSVFFGLLFVLMFCLLIPVFIFGRMAVEMLIAILTSDDLSLPGALSRLWQITQSHFWPLVLMTLLLLIIDIIANIVVSLPISIVQQVLMQVLMMSSARQQVFSMQPGELFRWIFIFQLVFLPVILILQTLIYTFHLSAISLVYAGISSKPIPPQPPVDVAPLT